MHDGGNNGSGYATHYNGGVGGGTRSRIEIISWAILVYGEDVKYIRRALSGTAANSLSYYFVPQLVYNIVILYTCLSRVKVTYEITFKIQSSCIFIGKKTVKKKCVFFKNIFKRRVHVRRGFLAFIL